MSIDPRRVGWRGDTNRRVLCYKTMWSIKGITCRDCESHQMYPAAVVLHGLSYLHLRIRIGTTCSTIPIGNGGHQLGSYTPSCTGSSEGFGTTLIPKRMFCALRWEIDEYRKDGMPLNDMIRHMIHSKLLKILGTTVYSLICLLDNVFSNFDSHMKYILCGGIDKMLVVLECIS